MMQERKVDPIKIEKLRKKRIKRKRRLFIAVVLVISGALTYFTGLYGASLSILGDVIDTVAITLEPGEGWPQTHMVSSLKATTELSGGFAALGDSDLAIFSPTGKLLQSIQHGYGHPAMSAGNTRVCLYNRTGKELRIESRTKNLFTTSFDQPIFLAKMAAQGSYAVVTGSVRYEAQVTIYNSLFDLVYTWYSAKDSPVSLAISDNGRNVAVGCLRPNNGALGGAIYLLDTSKDSELAKIEIDDGIPLTMQFLPNGDLAAVFDMFAAIYSGVDGSLVARYDFGERTIQTADIEGKSMALVFGSETQESLTELVVLDSSLESVMSVNLGRVVNSVTLTRTNVYIVLAQSVLTYSLSGELIGETDIDNTAFCLLDEKNMLLITKDKAVAFEPPSSEK